MLAASAVAQQTFQDSIPVMLTSARFDSTNYAGQPTCALSTIGVHRDIQGRGLDSDYTYVGRIGDVSRRYYLGPDVPAWANDPGDIPGERISYWHSSSGSDPCGDASIIGRHLTFQGKNKAWAVYMTTKRPVALFEWEQTQGYTVRLDGAASYVATNMGKRPVQSYRWSYGDDPTSAVTEHTFLQPGEYDVTLTVTDDEGQEDAWTRTIVVTGHLLTVVTKPLNPDPNRFYSRGDTIVVETTVTNTGESSVIDVVIPRLGTVPVSREGGFPLGVAPLNDAVYARIGSETAPIERAVFEKGEEVAFVDTFRVDGLQVYRSASGDVTVNRGHSYAEYSSSIQGTSLIDEPVVVRVDCKGGTCQNGWIVGPRVKNIALQFRTTAGDDVREVQSGITHDEAVGLAGHTGFVNANWQTQATGTAGDPDNATCMSGCVELVAVLTDEQENPVEDRMVRFNLPPMDGLDGVVTTYPRGGFVCEKASSELRVLPPSRCSQSFVEVKTDEDGEARAIWAVQGMAGDGLVVLLVKADAMMRPSVFIEDVQASEGFTVRPNKALETVATLNAYDSAFIGLGRGMVLTGGAGNFVGDYCENGNKWLRDQTGVQDQTSSLKNVGLFLTNVGTSWVCEGFTTAASAIPLVGWLTSLGAEADAEKKLGQMNLYLWTLGAYDVKNPWGLSLASGPHPPPATVYFDGDFFEWTVAATVELAGGASLTQSRSLAGVTTRLRGYEVSTLSLGRDPSDLGANFQSFHSELEEASSGGWKPVSKGTSEFLYDPDAFLRDGFYQTVFELLGVIDGDANAGSLNATLPPGNWEPGVFIYISDGLNGEVAQISNIPEGRTANAQATPGVAVEFVTPLLNTYEAGAEVAFVAEGIVGPPARPVLIPNLNPEVPVELGWIAGGTTAVATYDIQIATDEAMTSLLLDETTDLTSAPISPDAFSDGTTYYWRVRATNRFGTSSWTETAPFTAGETVVTPNDDSVSGLPDVLALAVYPNPATQRAMLGMDLPEPGRVRAVLYDALGRQVALLANEDRPAGRHALAIQVAGLPAGAYVVRVEAGGDSVMQRLTVVR